MTNPRKVYLRKKDDNYIFECKVKGNTTYLWTIPKNYECFLKDLCKSSFFGKDKANKLMTILAVADYKNDLNRNVHEKVPTIEIRGTPENPDKVNELDEENEELIKRVSQLHSPE
jgi:hypothetical protein